MKWPERVLSVFLVIVGFMLGAIAGANFVANMVGDECAKSGVFDLQGKVYYCTPKKR